MSLATTRLSEQPADIGLLAQGFPPRMAGIVDALNDAYAAVISVSGPSSDQIIRTGKHFRSELRAHWKSMADILQDSRQFAAEVDMLHRYSRGANAGEIRRTLKGMSAIAKELMGRIVQSEGVCVELLGKFPYAPDVLTQGYGSYEQTVPLQGTIGEVNIRGAQKHFQSLLQELRGLHTSMLEFWKRQLAIVDNSLEGNHPNRISLRMEDAAQLASDWDKYDLSLEDAINKVLDTSDEVVVVSAGYKRVPKSVGPLAFGRIKKWYRSSVAFLKRMRRKLVALLERMWLAFVAFLTALWVRILRCLNLQIV
ncbi:hypothetical protein FRC17_009075 [Serendipita sp. 399]|nr:hypothetical protein FRC17_009075 [Serendipita sp. 399]